MTAVASRPTENAVWGTMPGWGIVADLTPPELAASRRLKVLKKLIAVGLVMVALLCVAGYAWAFLDHSSASDALDTSNARTTQLVAEQGKYAKVTQILATTDSVNQQIATVMTTEVDASLLLAKLRDTLPGTMSLTSMSVTLANTSATGSGTSSLDTSGRPVVGTVTVTGTAQRMADVATYVTLLSSVPGVVNVVPSSNNSAANGGAQWSMTLQVNDKLYTHRYDFKPSGSN